MQTNELKSIYTQFYTFLYFIIIPTIPTVQKNKLKFAALFHSPDNNSSRKNKFPIESLPIFANQHMYSYPVVFGDSHLIALESFSSQSIY